MDATANHIGPHRETVAALRRAGSAGLPKITDRSYAAQIAGVLCMAVAVLINETASALGLLLVGGSFLWAAMRRDDLVADSDVEDQFDGQTGLPLASALPAVLTDDLATRSLTGRLAIAAIDIPEIAAAEARGEADVAESLLATTTHRLQTQGWGGDAPGPYAPLVFVRRPGVFIVVLRDVLDDRTTEWLAERVVKVIGAPIGFHGVQFHPSASIGVAIGDAGNNHDLLAAANEARLEARRRGPGAVCVFGDDPTAALDRLPHPIVSHGDETEVGLEFDLEPNRSPQAALYFGLADFSRNLERALESHLEGDGGLCFVPVSPVALCRADARQRILARINDGRAHDRVALVVPSGIDAPGLSEAWSTIHVLRQCGLHVFVDRSRDAAHPRPLPIEDIDGIIVGHDHTAVIDAAYERGLEVVVRWPLEPTDDVVTSADSHLFGTDRTLEDALNSIQSGALGGRSSEPTQSDRLIRQGREAQLTTGPSVTSRR